MFRCDDHRSPFLHGIVCCLISYPIGSFVVRTYSALSYLFIRFHFSCCLDPNSLLHTHLQACISVSIIAHVKDVRVSTLRQKVEDNRNQIHPPTLLSLNHLLHLHLCSISLYTSPLLPLRQSINLNPIYRPRMEQPVERALAMEDAMVLEVHQLVQVAPHTITLYKLWPRFLPQMRSWQTRPLQSEKMTLQLLLTHQHSPLYLSLLL